MGKRVAVVGGTGFLGYHAVVELLRRGFEVTALGLKDFPARTPPLNDVDVQVVDLRIATDADLGRRLAGFDAVVFAAGADERATPRTPALDFFRAANVVTTERVLRLAKEGGARSAVVLGSYFAYFAKAWPELRLAERHPYIRSRLEQQEVAAASGMRTVVLQLPYIFGSAPGQIPLWAPLVRYLARMPLLLYPRGGTNAVAVRHVGEAVAGAVEGTAAGPILVGDENLRWADLLQRLLAALGRRKSVVTLPTAALYPSALIWRLVLRIRGQYSGLDPLHFIPLQTRETFFDPRPGWLALDFEGGELDQAIVDTVRTSIG